MTNLFKVRLNRKSEDFEKRFELAFDDIYALAEKLSTSENVIIKKYDAFLMAIMSIFYHHVPGTEFYSEVEVYEESFDDGVILARVANDKIENPFVGQYVPLAGLDADRDARAVYCALMGISVPKKEVRFYRD